jgi:hypothetical protein
MSLDNVLDSLKEALNKIVFYLKIESRIVHMEYLIVVLPV